MSIDNKLDSITRKNNPDSEINKKKQIAQAVASTNNIMLSDIQATAAVSFNDNLIMDAVPGAGKTTVLQIGYVTGLLTQDLHESTSLFLSLTNAAVKNVEQKIQTLLDSIAERSKVSTTRFRQPAFSTIHKQCKNIVEAYVMTMYNKKLHVRDNIMGIVATSFSNWCKIQQSDLHMLPDIDSILKAIYQADQKLILTEDSYNLLPSFAEVKSSFDKVLEVKELIDSNLLQLGYCEQGQLPSLAIVCANHVRKLQRLKEKSPDLFAMLGEKDKALANHIVFTKKYKHMFIDEFQDVNPVLAATMSTFCEKLIVVGDGDQSIYYSMNGARGNIREMFESLRPNSKYIYIDKTYRCPEDVVNYARNILRYNYATTAVPKYDHAVTIPDCVTSLDIQTFADSKLLELSDKYLEINRAVKSGAPIPKYDSDVILYKTNLELAIVVDRLYRDNTPWQVVGGKYTPVNQFYQFEYMNILINAVSGNQDNLLQIIREVEPDLVGPVRMMLEGGRDWRTLTTASVPFLRLATLATEFPDVYPVPVVEFLGKFIDYYVHYLEPKIQNKFFHDIEYIIGIISRVSAGRTWREFLEHESKKQRLAAEVQTFHAPTLMTYHKSKGLEADNIYMTLPQNSAILKFVHARKQPTDVSWKLAEECNLFYVGATRAKKSLCVIGEDPMHPLFSSDFMDEDYTQVGVNYCIQKAQPNPELSQILK